MTNMSRNITITLKRTGGYYYCRFTDDAGRKLNLRDLSRLERIDALDRFAAFDGLIRETLKAEGVC